MQFPRFFPALIVAAPLFCATSSWAAPPLLAPAAIPAPASIDARAVALLDESVKAYAAANSLAQNFAFTERINGKLVTEQSGQGTLMWLRPGRVRVEFENNGQPDLALSDGTTLIMKEQGKNAYVKAPAQDDLIAAISGGIPSAAGAMLNLLLEGKNPLKPGNGPKWQSAHLVTSVDLQGVALTWLNGATQRPATYRIFLDPKTHLVARIEAELETPARKGAPGQPDIAAAKHANVTIFTPNPTQVVPALFDFKKPEGATLTDAPPEPDYFDPKLVVGAAPFPLSQKTLDGQPFSLDAYKGKVVLLDFWATWCGPCVAELPNVQANYAKFHPKGFDVVGVSLDEEETELRDFIKARKMPWPQIFEGTGWQSADAQTYGVKAIPFTLLIGKDGKIAAVNPRGAQLQSAIEKALAG